MRQRRDEREPERQDVPDAPVAPALGPASVLALQRTAGNAAVARMLSTAPGPRLQRVAFTLGRNHGLANEQQRRSAIHYQNQLIDAITELYVPRDMDDANSAYVALQLHLDGTMTEARRQGRVVPRDTDFVSS